MAEERLDYGFVQTQAGRPIGRVPEMPDLKEHIMETLAHPDIYMIGVCGEADDHMSNLFDSIIRRVTRDDLFGVTVMLSITDKPDLTIIQQEIAHQLGFSYQDQEKRMPLPSCCVFPSRRNKKVMSENAKQLFDRIRNQPKILFILCDLRTRVDLAELGIPFGADHKGCKFIITSQSEDILSKINVQLTHRV